MKTYGYPPLTKKKFYSILIILVIVEMLLATKLLDLAINPSQASEINLHAGTVEKTVAVSSGTMGIYIVVLMILFLLIGFFMCRAYNRNSRSLIK